MFRLSRFLPIFAALCFASRAAIPGGANWDIAPGLAGASNTNGGFFVPGAAGTIDYSQGAPHASGNDLNSNNANQPGGATITLTSSYIFQASDVNNGIYINCGGTTGYYQLKTYNAGTHAMTVDRNISSSASVNNCSYAEGGSLIDPGIALNNVTPGNIVHLQAPSGGYTVSSSTINGVAGILNISVPNVAMIGYRNSHYDYGTQFTINTTAGAGANTILSHSGSTFPYLANITINCNNNAGQSGYVMRVGVFFNIWVENCPTAQSTVTSSSTPPIQIGNYVTGATSGSGALSVTAGCFGCEAINNAVSGFTQPGLPADIFLAVYSISALNTGATSHGARNLGNYITLIADTFANNGGDGLNINGNGDSGAEIIDSIIEGNAGWAFDTVTAAQFGFQVNNTSWFNNGAGAYNANTCPTIVSTNYTCWIQPMSPAQSSTAFVNLNGGNFTLNTNPTGGLLMRGAGYPTQYRDGINQTYLSLGAVQPTNSEIALTTFPAAEPFGVLPVARLDQTAAHGSVRFQEPLSCCAPSITVDRLLYSGRPDPEVEVTNSTSPGISTLESYLQSLPVTSPPSWPYLGPAGYLLENNGVAGFPQEVQVFQGVIRIFANGVFFYYQDVNGLENYLNSLFLSLFGTVDPSLGGQPSATPGPGGDPLPRSGGEPPFNPNPWNDHGVVQHNNNSYNYATNKMTGTEAQLGKEGGRLYSKDKAPDAANACNNGMASAIADGLTPWVANVPCPADEYKVALLIAPGIDYHWYRQDSDGNWSHKRGPSPAMNVDESNPPKPITDPRTATRALYENFCGFLCVRSDPAAVNIAFVVPPYAKEWLSYLF